MRGSGAQQHQPPEPEEQGAGSFGLTLQNLTPQIARRLQMPSGQSGAVITDVDPNGPSAGALRPGDVILSVNGRPVANAAEAGRELQKVASGRIAQHPRLARRRRGVRDGRRRTDESRDCRLDDCRLTI